MLMYTHTLNTLQAFQAFWVLFFCIESIDFHLPFFLQLTRVQLKYLVFSANYLFLLWNQTLFLCSTFSAPQYFAACHSLSDQRRVQSHINIVKGKHIREVPNCFQLWHLSMVIAETILRSIPACFSWKGKYSLQCTACLACPQFYYL